MSLKQFFAAALIIPAIGLSVAPAFASAEEVSGADSEARHRYLPLSGELISYDDSSLTILLSEDSPRSDVVFEKLELVAGDEVTFSLSDETKYMMFDADDLGSGEGPVEASLADFAIGETAFIASQLENDELSAMVVSNHAPKRVQKAHRGRPIGEVNSIDTDANIIVVERASEDNDWISTTITINYNDDVSFFEAGDELTEYDIEAGDMISARAYPKDSESAGQLQSIMIVTPQE